ncbi:hypothetical protein GYH30_009960 [Glycine max]|uniref:BED-type domain-containing protein n=1 Tax=Glycine max TaxID=3847 RepID=A0A0R0KEK1_SOYBN|nr:hypothetical protein JHK86_010181 [Glycine max]KAH1111392.1 hypothetical protein GYH30_009960 [Glycine max]
MVGDERNEHVPPTTNQLDGDKKTNQEEKENVIKKKRKKTSSVWKDFDEVEIVGAGKKEICKYWKVRLSIGGPRDNTSHLRRHSEKCNERRLHVAKEKNQFVIPFKPYNPSNPFLIPGVKYSNERMREIIATNVIVHEYLFGIVEAEVWMWALQYGNPDFQKCLKTWEIEEKVFSVSVANASYNDSCLKNLKENLSLSTKLVMNEDLIHVRCRAHILNLLVRDELEVWRVKQVIDNA